MYNRLPLAVTSTKQSVILQLTSYVFCLLFLVSVLKTIRLELFDHGASMVHLAPFLLSSFCIVQKLLDVLASWRISVYNLTVGNDWSTPRLSLRALNRSNPRPSGANPCRHTSQSLVTLKYAPRNLH